MDTKIEIENLCPMVAMISAGKTSLLRVIFDIDFLEATAGIGTKFVNIIRYNPDVGKSPKFYHLKLKKIGDEDYEYYKDTNFGEIVGKDEIKKKNEELNAEYKSTKTVNYEDLFYMIEVGEANLIEDKEYLKHYDLVDIPGVNEFNPNETPKQIEKPSEDNKGDLPPPEPLFEDFELNEKEESKENNQKNAENLNLYESMEDEMINYNPKNEQNYLTEIFKIIKNKMNNGIIVFSVDNYQHAENYRIIAKLQKVINKPIENFLILLNKIDKSENREYDLNTLNCKIMKYFPSCKQFNPTKNLIVACSKIQLENESKMSKSFYHLLYYHFLNYLMSSRSIDSGTPTPTTAFNFIDFLKKIGNQKIKKKKLVEQIEKIIKDSNFSKIVDEIRTIIRELKVGHLDDNLNLGVREDDIKEDEIIKNVEKLKEEEEGDDQEDEEKDDTLNLDDLAGNITILYNYSEFKNNKNIPPLSSETQNIMDYFTMKNMEQYLKEEDNKLKEEDKKKIIEEKSSSQKIDDISQRMMEFYKEYENEALKKHNLEKLRKYINSSIGILKTSKLLYIPMLGVSNAGKSTILNGIIGKRILPAQKNECTKKGLLIKHWEKDYPVIRKTRFKKEKLGNDDIYYFESEEDIIAKDIDNIHHVLEGTNGEFTGKEEDFFYEIDINIKFVNDLKIEGSLKEKICFIDLPGFGTNNEFEKKGVYAHLMKSCNIFLFVVFNLKIKEADNKRMLDKLYHQMSDYRGVTAESFIQKCLFIINYDKDQDTSDKSLFQAKNDIISVVDGLKSQNVFKDLNVCFFNAKFYENYIFKLSYYKSVETLVQYEYKIYKKLIEQKWRGLGVKIKGGGPFNKFLKEVLKDNIGHDIEVKFDENKVKPNEVIEKSLREINQNYAIKIPEKDLFLISKYITYGNENLGKSNLLSNSNIVNFSKDLLISINKAKQKEDEDINYNLKQSFKILDNVFEVDPNTKFGPCKDAPIAEVVKPHVQEDLNNMINEIEKLLNLIRNEFANNDIAKLLTSKSTKISASLTNEKSNIKNNLRNKKCDKVQKQFEEIFTNETNELKDELLSTLENCSNNIDIYLNQCYDKLDLFYSNKIERKNILFKNYISNCLGGENDIEQTINELINDIINGSRSATSFKNRSGFFNWLGSKLFDDSYLSKIIDYIIQKSIPKIKLFSDKIGEESEKFKRDIIDEIESSKDRVKEELERKKEEEELAINAANAKNEEEKQKWEEEKRIYEENKKRWEILCKKYRVLRDEITSLRLGKDHDETETGEN